MKPIQFSRLRTSRRIRQFNLSLVATLAVMALAACGGGGSDAPAMPAAVIASVMLQEDGTPMPMPGSDADAAMETLTNLAPVTTSEVSFTNSDGLVIPAWLYKPAGTGTLPTVVMMHGCSGAYSYSDPAKGVSGIHKEWAKRLNDAGYAALLVDSFTPRGTQNQCGNGVAGVDEAIERPKDARAALQWIVGNGLAPADRVALIGWSNGGSATMAALDSSHATPGSLRFAGGFSFYPGCGLLNNFGGISQSSWLPYAPLEILHASTDPLYTSGSCTTRVNRAHMAGAAGLNLTVYPGARHSFDLATSVKAPYTQADVEAKQAADAVVMQKLASLFTP